MRARIVAGPLRVLGSGAALPGPPVTTEALLDRLGASFGFGALRRALAMDVAERMGIRERYLCRDFVEAREVPRQGDSNPELAARAVQEALVEAGLESEGLAYLFGHTTSPHTLLPPNVSWVADRLGYGGPYAELRQACTGFANALQLAEAMLARPDSQPVAIVGSETGSVFFDPAAVHRESHQLVSVVQMGDGAGAVVLGPEDGTRGPRIRHLFFGSLGVGYTPGLSLEVGGSGFPHAEGTLTFKHDFAGVKRMGPCLYEQGVAAARAAGIDLGTVDWILPHQANARLGEYLAPLLSIPAERFVVDADKVGNLGSASMWVALHRLRKSGRLQQGQTVLVLGAESTKYLYGGFLYEHEA